MASNAEKISIWWRTLEIYCILMQLIEYLNVIFVSFIKLVYKNMYVYIRYSAVITRSAFVQIFFDGHPIVHPSGRVMGYLLWFCESKLRFLLWVCHENALWNIILYWTAANCIYVCRYISQFLYTQSPSSYDTRAQYDCSETKVVIHFLLSTSKDPFYLISTESSCTRLSF